MQPQFQALERLYAAVNRNDMLAVADDLDPAIVRIEPEGFDTAGIHRGIDAVRAQIAQGRATWAEGRCEPERFLVNGDRIVAYLHARVRLVDAIDWIDGRFADGFVFRDGRIVEFRTFWERVDALAWAGIDEPAAS